MATHDGPSLERLYSINLDGSRRHIQPADVRGRFLTGRRLAFAVLIVVYLALPIVNIHGHPAVHLDIAQRRFYLFGAMWNAQDAWMMFLLFTSAAFGLLFFTAWLGRVWCGFACPQTVFLEGVYRPIERLIEGPREARIKRDAGPLTLDKAIRKTLKHLCFVAVSLFIAHVTISLFVSGRSLVQMVQHNPAEHWVAFAWTMAIAGAFYFNFFWFREQLCVVICPYGRLQSALTDKDSLLIGYDARRGEPRGKVGSTKGACVDCHRCVAVCPTGIDIRQGLQMECIGCTQCIDACDEIMDKLERPRGLIRYDSQNAFEGKPRRMLRPRVIAYGALLFSAFSGLVAVAATRTPFDAALIRNRQAPYVLDGATVRNQYELHVTNKNAVETTFHLVPAGVGVTPGFVVGQNDFTLAPLESLRIPIFASVPRADFHLPFEVAVTVSESAGTATRVARARFLGPMDGAH